MGGFGGGPTGDGKAEPSIFHGALRGAGVGGAIGVVVVTCAILAAGRFEAAAGLQVLVCSGALGAITGYHLTVRRRKALGFKGPLDQWPRFLTSPMGFAIALIVILGSFVVAILMLLAYRALTGRGG